MQAATYVHAHCMEMHVHVASGVKIIRPSVSVHIVSQVLNRVSGRARCLGLGGLGKERMDCTYYIHIQIPYIIC